MRCSSATIPSWRTSLRSSVTPHLAFTARIRAAHPAVAGAHDEVQPARMRQHARDVADGFKLVAQGDDARPELELGGTVAASEIGECGRLLRIELPVEHRHERLHDVIDDRGTAWRAGDHEKPPVMVVHHRRCHGRAWPLARLYAIRHGLAVALRHEREIRELVVEQE